MNILITGVSGFLGSNLTYSLLNNRDINKVYGSFRNKENVHQKIIKSDKFFGIEGNIDSLPNYIFNDVDLVIHAAGSAANSRDLSNEMIAKSLTESTLSICEKIRLSKNRPVLYYFSSGAIYGSNCDIKGFCETDPLVLNYHEDTYSASKIYLESLLQEYSKWFPIVSLRLFSFMGEGYKRNFPYALASFINLAVKNEDILIKNPDSKRNYMDVESLSYVISNLIGMKYNFNKTNFEALNIGSRSVMSIYELAALVIDLTSSKSKIIIGDQIDKNNLRNFYYPRLKKLENLMEVPELRIDESIRKTLKNFL